MFLYLKYIIQLFLSPDNGWDDLRDSAPAPKHLLKAGFYPLIVLCAITELLPWFYRHDVSMMDGIIGVIASFAAYFTGLYASKLIFDIYLPRVAAHQPDADRVDLLSLCGIGMMILIRIIDNILPWDLVLLQFLPIYVVLVLYKGAKYLDVPASAYFRFTALASVALVLVPIIIYDLLSLIVK